MILLVFFLMVLIQFIFSYLNISVDVIFIFVFWVNYRNNDIISLIYSFFAGLYMDFYYQFPFGVCSLTMIVLSGIIANIKYKMDIEMIASRFVSFITMNYIFNLFLFIFSFIVSSQNYFNLKFLYLPFINFFFFEIFKIAFEKVYNKKYSEVYYD